MSQTTDINRKALTAGVWYTISNFVVRGIGFLTTPIFTRILSKADYGNYSNYTSWLNLLIVLTTFEMYSSINRARFDYEDDLDGYLSSVALCGTTITLVCYAIVLCFQNFFVQLFNMDMIYIHVMFLYLLVEPALPLLSTQYRLKMKYKLVTVLSLASTLLSVIMSLLLVFVMENQLMGRIVGYTAPLFLVNLIIYIYILYRGKKNSFSYWKYALSISVPLVPHLLANSILGSTDRIMITNFCGAEKTALYSVMYSCSLTISILMTSVNQAWVPWFYENINKRKYSTVKSVSRIYILAFCSLSILLMLSAPEFVLIFAGSNYLETVDLMPSIMLGCVMQFLYTLYVNVEFYHKKSFGISVRTIIAALLNLFLNWIFIPLLGYKAAAYTTLIGYFVLFVLHYFAAKKFDTSEYFDNKYIYKVVFGVSLFSAVVFWSYQNDIVRYILFLVVLLITGIFLYKNKEKILSFIKRN